MSFFQKHGIDFSEITEHIFIGTNGCCQTHFNEVLISKAITSDISLEAERLDAAEGADIFLWLPTIDHTPITRDKLQLGVQVITELVAQNKKIYVHCKNGHGRSPMLVAAYLMQSQNISAEEAIRFIKSKRPSIHLDQDQIEALH